MYLDKNAILNSLTKEDIVKVCESLGNGSYKDGTNDSLCFNTCLCHGGDSPYKLIYYPHPNTHKYPNRKVPLFHCYTCGDTYDLVELYIRAKRQQGITITWHKALYSIAQLTGKIVTSSPERVAQQKKVIDDFGWINKIRKVQNRDRSIPLGQEINENILEIFDYTPYQGWLDEHITREALNRFEIGYYGLTNQITIPHRDLDGNLIGIRGRYLDDVDVRKFGKYVPLTINGKFLNHPLGDNLYGLNVVKDKVKECGKVLLCEGEKSVLQCYSYFGEDSFAVSVCGSNISQTQMRILLQIMCVKEVIVAFDREYEDPDSFEATVYYNKLIKKVAPLVPYCQVYLVLDKEYRIPYKASPTDCGKEILMELMKEKILITSKEVEEVYGRYNQ